MNLSHNTILITGGSSGIGLELVKQLIEKNNTIIICGRSKEKLNAAQIKYPGIYTIPCDISIPSECMKLKNQLEEKHPALNLIINNAAIVHKEPFIDNPEIMNKIEQEINTNLLAPIRLIHLLYPLIIKNKQPAIVNVTTGLVYTPRVDYPIYNATKSALHSFTQVLRLQNQNAQLKIIEALFPVVDTPWHKGNPPKIAIPPEIAVKEMIKELEKGKEEIRIGKVKLLYYLSRIAPQFALRKLNSFSK